MKKREAAEMHRAMNARLDLATTADLLNELADRSAGIVVAYIPAGTSDTSVFFDGALPTCIGLVEMLGRSIDAEIEQRMA